MATYSTEKILELSPSAKLVFYVLNHHGSLTQQQIRNESLLASRTVRYALTRLDENELVDSRSSLKDARQQIYSLSERGEAIAQRL